MLLRRLIGILELPGMVIFRTIEASQFVDGKCDVERCSRRCGHLHFLSELGLEGSGEYGNHMPLRLFREGVDAHSSFLLGVSYIGGGKRNNLFPYIYPQSFTKLFDIAVRSARLNR